MFELYDYWRDYPPMHECLKVAYGIARKPAASAPPSAPTGDFSALVQQFPGGIVA